MTASVDPSPAGMVRRLLNLLTTLSLLLCVAVAALWVGSHTHPTTFSIRTAPSYGGRPSLKFVAGDSQLGAVALCLYVETNPSSTGGPYTPAERAAYRAENEAAFEAVPLLRRKPIERPYDPLQYRGSSGVRHVGYWSATSPYGDPYYRSNDDEFPGIYRLFYVRVAYWPLFLLFSVLPSLWLLRGRRTARRIRRRLCPSCGYDLRATPDRCPECGAGATAL